VLVNNAGVGYIGAVETFPWDLARTTMETNFWGAIRTIRAALPTMRSQGSGRIVNVTSVAALIPASFNAYYSASKVALDRLTEALGWEVARFGIKLALVEPGFYATSITDKSIATQGDIADGPYADVERQVRDFYAKGVADGGDSGVRRRQDRRSRNDGRPSDAIDLRSRRRDARPGLPDDVERRVRRHRQRADGPLARQHSGGGHWVSVLSELGGDRLRDLGEGIELLGGQ